MSQEETYVNWDFETVWEFAEGADYPTLKGLDIADTLLQSNAENPNIILQPANTTALINEPLELTMEAAVTKGVLTYQWYVSTDGTYNGTLIPGATQPGYTPPTDTAGTWYYYCEVTNTDITAFRSKTAIIVSDIVFVSVDELTSAETPNITVQPVDTSITVGEAITLTVEAEVIEGTLSYQWYESLDGTNANGILIPEATQSSYSPLTYMEGTRYYYCEVTNTDIAATGTQTASANSAAVSVTVNVLVDAQFPVITWQPSDIEVFTDEQATLTIEATVVQGELTYQWYISADGTYNGTLIPGADQPTYTPPTDTAGTWYYYCEVTNSDIAATGNQTAVSVSDVVTVTVNSDIEIELPYIVSQPIDIVCYEGDFAELLIETAATEGTISYQWYESTDGTNINGISILGANQAAYTPPTDTEGMRVYYCVVTYTDGNGNLITVLISDIMSVTIMSNSVLEEEELSA
jgi:quinol monooxygenase YgiN